MGVTHFGPTFPIVFDQSDVGGSLIPAIPFTWTAQRIAAGTILWVSQTAAQNDTVIIQDLSGNELWRSTATGADWVDDNKFPDTESWNGFVIAQFPSGILHLHPR